MSVIDYTEIVRRQRTASLAEVDPEVYALIQRETARQEQNLELIASENITSRAVREAVGSVMTDKYAEGYPGKRYYGGCAEVDKAEVLAQKRAQQLFKTDYAVNVQPHSGSQANMAAYHACELKPGDRIMGLSLDCGGHLTHGHPANFSGRDYQVASYGVDPATGRIDMEAVARQAREFKPKVLVAGASNYSRTLDFAAFGTIAKEVGALFIVDMAHIAGLIAAGLHPTPFGHADLVTTTTHKTLRGPRGGMIFARDPEIAKRVNSRIFPGIQGGPLMHVIAAKAVAFGEALQPAYAEYMGRVKASAAAMADELIRLGWAVVSGGTDTHLFSLNVMSQGVTGKQRNDIRWKEVEEGKLPMPREPRTLYVLTGSSFDPATNEVKDSYLRWVIYIPYATAQSTGLSTKPAEGVPWLMHPGTAGAHIMISPPRKK